MAVRLRQKPVPLPMRRPHDYAVVLVLTAGAYEIVRARIDGVTDTAELDWLNGMPRYRVALPAASPDVEQLSPRELDVLRLVAEGMSYPEISRALSVSTETTKTHATNMLRKLGARDRTNAVHIAHKRALFDGGR